MWRGFLGSELIQQNGADNIVGYVTDGTGIAIGMGVSDDFDNESIMGISTKPYFSEIFSIDGWSYRVTINVTQDTKRVNVVFDTCWGKAVGQASKLVPLSSGA